MLWMNEYNARIDYFEEEEAPFVFPNPVPLVASLILQLFFTHRMFK